MLFLLLAGAVEVESPSACPAAQAVTERLAVLLPATRDVPDRARLSRSGDRLSLELRRADGTAIAWRRLDAQAACEDLAEAAAVMIATWETELEAGRTLPPPPQLERESAPVDKSPAVEVRRPRGGWELGVGFAASVANGVFLPGVIIDTETGSARWAARLAITATESQEEQLGMGTARWNRLSFAAGPSFRFGLVDVHAEAVGALVHVEGVGYAQTYDEYGFDPGIGVGLRFALRPAPLVPWVGASAVGWLRKEELRVVGVGGGVTLPAVDVLVSAGISFGVKR